MNMQQQITISKNNGINVSNNATAVESVCCSAFFGLSMSDEGVGGDIV